MNLTSLIKLSPLLTRHKNQRAVFKLNQSPHLAYRDHSTHPFEGFALGQKCRNILLEFDDKDLNRMEIILTVYIEQ